MAGFKRSVVLAAALMAVKTAICWADGPSREYLVKAAFLYNFTQFVSWPSDAFAATDSPFVVAVVGDDPFSGALEKAMSGKSVANHPIQVQHFSSADQLGDCQMLFVPASEDSNLSEIIGAEAKRPVLTVGETDAFSPAGGCMRFYLEDGKVRFEIGPDAVDEARLKVSAKLMNLARIYKK